VRCRNCAGFTIGAILAEMRRRAAVQQVARQILQAAQLGRLTRVALGAVGAVRCCQSIEREQTQRDNLGGYSLLATALKVCVRLVPTRAIMLTAATPISDAIKAYSIAVTPS